MFIRKFVLIILFSIFFIFNNNFINKSLATNDPGVFIMDMTQGAIQNLTSSSANMDEKEKKFGELFDKNFDLPSISRFVLGKYWKNASIEQKKKFIKTFRNYVVKTYSSRFSEYSGENLKLVKFENESNPKIFLVYTVLERQDAPLIKINWRVGKKKDKFVILDIVIEGISLAVTQRSEFVSVIEQNNGEIDSLISLLEEKL
tara:strand:+ start:11272 stop:11877 length:606 start_codon:yes stop_codon:yes gene_type:complete